MNLPTPLPFFRPGRAAQASRPEPELRPDGDWPEPPVPTFRLLSIDRKPEYDRLGRLAFDVVAEVNEVFRLAPCLYLLATNEARCGFALAEHATWVHHNGLMMTIVDQDRAYEALAEFEERILAHARRLAPPKPVTEDDDAFFYAPAAAPELAEPPSWATEVLPFDGHFAIEMLEEPEA